MTEGVKVKDENFYTSWEYLNIFTQICVHF